MRVQVYPADESRLGRLASVHQPTFLMLTICPLRAVPAGAKARTARRKHLTLLRRAREDPRFVPSELGIGAPEERPNIEASICGAVQYIEQRPSLVRHFEVGPHKSDGRPDAVPCRVDRLTDTPERGFPIDQGPHQITRPHGIRAGRCEWDVRLNPLGHFLCFRGRAPDHSASQSGTAASSGCGSWTKRPSQLRCAGGRSPAHAQESAPSPPR